MTITDVAAWVGAAAGIAALIWQAATRRRSPHNVVVTRSQSFLTYPTGAMSPDLVGVTASNVGAGPVTVTGWGIDSRDGSNIILPRQLPGASPLPHRLEQGANGTWFVEAEEIRNRARERGVSIDDARKWRAWVSLATGQKVYAKRGLVVHETGYDR